MLLYKELSCITLALALNSLSYLLGTDQESRSKLWRFSSAASAVESSRRTVVVDVVAVAVVAVVDVVADVVAVAGLVFVFLRFEVPFQR